MKTIRLGFVGAGKMGQCAHLRNYAVLEGCEVAALAELRPELARRVAARYGIPRVYADHREMLEAETLDAIVAVQPYNRHGVLLPELYGAGLPVLTEKPLACSVEAGERLLERLAGSGARHYLGYHKRSDPATERAKEEIERLKCSGELGPLRYVRITMPPGDWIAGGFDGLIDTGEPLPELACDPPPEGMAPEMQQAYDTFVNYYVHQVNLMRRLLGEDYEVAYAGAGGVAMAVQSRSGVDGVIEMAPYNTTAGWEEQALAAFEKGYVKLELPAPMALNRAGRVSIYRDSGNGRGAELVEPRMPAMHAMRRQAEHFLRAVQGERTPLCEPEEALRDLQLAREYILMATAG